MKIFENTILSFEEQVALDQYTHNPNCNAFMTSKLTNREKSGKIGSIIPRDEEAFQLMLEQIILVYSAILKDYYFNKKNESPMFVYRGVRHEDNGESFLSTSTDIEKATSFCKSKSEENILYKIQIENIPFINLEELGENEILFPPSLIEENSEFEITEEEKEKIGKICTKKQIPYIKYKTVKFKLKDFSINDDLVDLDTLCEEYDSYLENIIKLKKLNPDSLEYRALVERIESYKKQIHNYLNSKFNEINNSILKAKRHYKSNGELIPNGKNGLDDCMQDDAVRTSTQQEATRVVKETALDNENVLHKTEQQR